MTKFILAIAALIACLLLTACGKSTTDHHAQNTHDEPAHQSAKPTLSTDHVQGNPHDLSALADELDTLDDGRGETDTETDIKPIITADGKTQIDWSIIHTSTPKADLTDYPYPIALDSTAVKNYAKAYHLTDQQAQHSIVISMASPEVLSKVLDQLKNGQYIAHRLTDGANMTLIITTTSDVVADKSDYVFEGEFGRGLVLPVIIEPSQKHAP